MQKLIALGAMLVLAVAMLIGLPMVRAWVWGKDGPTEVTSLTYDPVLRAQEESAIAEVMKDDTSVYDRTLDTRYLERLPSSQHELEAIFRNRKAERCEKIVAGEFVLSAEQHLPSPDALRASTLRTPYLRRPVLSVSLKVDEEDQRQLPRLSKGQILTFLDSSWLSLQARLVLDPVANEWRLHYRPLAAQAHFGESIRTEAFETLIEKTIEDIRGLGILRAANSGPQSGLERSPTDNVAAVDIPADAEPLPAGERRGGTVAATGGDGAEGGVNIVPTVAPQTAVWLFRFDAMPAGSLTPQKAYEFVFVHLEPVTGNDEGDTAFKLHTIFTTDQRRTFHHFSSEILKKLPTKPEETAMLAAVHFTEYGAGGLSPQQSVTRAITVNQGKMYRLSDLLGYLSRKQKAGSWEENVAFLIQGMVAGI
jgi:hypothetical protein